MLRRRVPRLDTLSGTLIGALGDDWKAIVDRSGNVEFLDGSPALRWYVAAEDRWHRPSDDVATRQRMIGGTPVVETRLRVPGGDVVQRLFVAPGRGVGPAMIMDVENESGRAVALAVTRTDVVTPRPPTDASITGRHVAELDLDSVPVVVPLGHRSRIRLAVPCSRSGSIDSAGYVERFPDWEDVVRGWTSLCERASQVVVPDIVDAVPVVDLMIAERCRAALDPPGEIRDADSAATALLAWRDAVSLGLDGPDDELVASAVEILMRAVRRGHRWSRDAARAVEAAARLLGRSATRDGSTPRALLDLTRVVTGALRQPSMSLPRALESATGEASRWVDRLESEMVRWSDDQEAFLCPLGIAPNRLGVDIEAHRLPVGPRHRVSFALRWHGAHPAVIWEVEGPSGLHLRSGVDAEWTTTRPSGEALWRMSASVEPPAPDALSFS